MNKEVYLQKRNDLISEAQSKLDSGDIELSQSITKQIEQLDIQFENEAKEQANLNALKNNFNAKNVTYKEFMEGKRNIMNLNENTTTTFSSETETDIYNSQDYRIAFMKNILNGEKIPDKFNTDSSTTTGNVGSVIPTTVMERIIERMEKIGNILSMVTRTSYKGGLSIPTSSVKPTAKWVSENSKSDRQNKTTGYISFSAYKLDCRIAISLEVSVMALPVFEATFVRQVSEAMTKALEAAIISGNGTGKPTGILSSASDSNTVSIAKSGKLTYKTLVEAEAALPEEYENDAIYVMTKKTFMSFIGMEDANGQPIARVNFGINGKPERTLLGRHVELVSSEYISNYSDTVTSDTIFAFIFRMSDYILNTNLDVTVKKYEDNDTDEQVTKAYMLVDGKVVDENSLVVLKKLSA